MHLKYSFEKSWTRTSMFSLDVDSSINPFVLSILKMNSSFKSYKKPIFQNKSTKFFNPEGTK